MGAIIIPFLTQVSYLRLVELPESPPRPLNPREVVGEAFQTTTVAPTSF